MVQQTKLNETKNKKTQHQTTGNLIEVKVDNHHLKPLPEVRSAFRVCLII